jgi:hypothetical protein
LALLIRSAETKSELLTADGCILNFKHTLLKVLDVAAGEGDPDFVNLCAGHGGTCGVVFLFSLSDVTHCCISDESEGD